jgi:hypothetical protein
MLIWGCSPGFISEVASRIRCIKDNGIPGVERYGKAEKYLFDRAGRLDGDFYTSLLPLADSMAQALAFCLSQLQKSASNPRRFL